MLCTSKRAKWVKNHVVQRIKKFDDYIMGLRNKFVMEAAQQCIKSKFHEGYSVKESKNSLGYHTGVTGENRLFWVIRPLAKGDLDTQNWIHKFC